MIKYTMCSFLATALFCWNTHAAFTCASEENIKLLDTDQAIDLAYNSGPKAGNFGKEIGVEGGDSLGGIFFMNKETSMGNNLILNMYPSLNKDIFKFMGASYDETYKHNYSGIFQPTYSSTRECRRQLLITGTSTGEIKTPDAEDRNGKYFTGWINAEICTPNIMQLFAAGTKYFEAQGKKMENIGAFLSFLDFLLINGKIEEEQVSQIKYSLNTDAHPDVYYAKQQDGHIAPRFSVKIKHMYFEAVDTGCTMHVVPFSAYSDVLEHEQHHFSEDTQKWAHGQAKKGAKKAKKLKDIKKVDYDKIDRLISEGEYFDPLFIMSYWKDADTIGFKSVPLNKFLNTP